MSTVKEIKEELDERGIDYSNDALKADLEILLVEVNADEALETVHVLEEIIDPNAHPDTQAK